MNLVIIEIILDPHVQTGNTKKETHDTHKEKPNEKDKNNIPVRAYLDQTVIPVLMQGMAELAKERPENPIEYLAHFLLKNSNENNK